jgi:hypothetical protein
MSSLAYLLHDPRSDQDENVRKRKKPKECPCKVTMRIMAALGGKKTAAMHARPTDAWTCEDWEDHFQEEETLLLPILRERGLGAEARRIRVEHDVMRRYYKKYGCMPDEALGEHAAFEDWLVSTHLADLDPLKAATANDGHARGRRGGAVAAGWGVSRVPSADSVRLMEEDKAVRAKLRKLPQMPSMTSRGLDWEQWADAYGVPAGLIMPPSGGRLARYASARGLARVRPEIGTGALGGPVWVSDDGGSTWARAIS